jgi:predicted membrane protein
VVFVIAGIYIITRSRKTDSFNPEDQTSHQDTIDDTAIFGGGDRVMTSSNFRGGNLTAIFGGSNIDLTSCQLAEGESVLDVFYMFGGSKIRVPQDWNVHLSVTGIFGGMSDKRTLVDPDKYATKTLYVKGIALFGGAELTN